MSPDARKITGFLLLAFLAVPTGLCSLVFTPMATDTFLARDAMARDFGMLALIGSIIGWAICGLSIWGAIRLARPKTPHAPPRDPTP
jgi:hypothetical protein